MSGTKFPTDLDTAADLPDISASDLEDAAGKEHDVMHTRLHEAVIALETKVGKDNSQDTSSFDYRINALEQGGGGGGGASVETILQKIAKPDALIDPHWSSVVSLCLHDNKSGYSAIEDAVSGITWLKGVLSNTETGLWKYPAFVNNFGRSAIYLEAGAYSNHSNSLVLGLNDFTVEFFVSPVFEKSDQYGRLFMMGANSNNGGLWLVRNFSSSMIMLQGYDNNNYFNIIAPSGGMANEQTVHIALTRQGDVWRLFQNGNKIAEGTTNYIISADNIVIGANGSSGGERLAGLYSNFRLTKGVARYTESFVPPVGPFQAEL